MWKLARRAIRTFYRIERVGEPLPDGPLLLVANHPNTLVDPALIQATAGCSIRFLAKSTLFAGHPLSWLIRASGAIPVYRRIDSGVDTSPLAPPPGVGGAICPEGISHSEGRLEPLRTGAAPMVIERRRRPPGDHRAGRPQLRARRQLSVAGDGCLRPAVQRG